MNSDTPFVACDRCKGYNHLFQSQTRYETSLTFPITQREFNATAMTQRCTHLVKTNDGTSTYVSYVIAGVQTKFAESAFHYVMHRIRRYYFQKILENGTHARTVGTRLSLPPPHKLEPGHEAKRERAWYFRCT